VAAALGFRYTRADGRPVRNPADLKRIRALAIPPAWKDVWISPDPKGHLQATGRDARGRKQYRYHSGWRACRDSNKFDRLEAFATVLPAIRARTAAHVARAGLSFRGKSGKRHSVDVNSRRLARIVRQCRDLPGQELFQYLDDDGRAQDVTSSDVNQYLRDMTGTDFTAKDFRTWAATVLAATALRENAGPGVNRPASTAQSKKHVVRAIEAVAGILGNTPAICRKSYIHPAVLECYMDGSMPRKLKTSLPASMRKTASKLKADELATLRLLYCARSTTERRKAA